MHGSGPSLRASGARFRMAWAYRTLPPATACLAFFLRKSDAPRKLSFGIYVSAAMTVGLSSWLSSATQPSMIQLASQCTRKVSRYGVSAVAVGFVRCSGTSGSFAGAADRWKIDAYGNDLCLSGNSSGRHSSPIKVDMIWQTCEPLGIFFAKLQSSVMMGFPELKPQNCQKSYRSYFSSRTKISASLNALSWLICYLSIYN